MHPCVKTASNAVRLAHPITSKSMNRLTGQSSFDTVSAGNLRTSSLRAYRTQSK